MLLGFVLTLFLGQPVHWNGPVGISADIHTQKIALKEAKKWGKVGKIKFERGAGIVISYEDLGELYGATMITLSGNEIVGAHIKINPLLVTFDAQLQVVLLHELGHALGLSHSNNRRAVMYQWIYGYSKLQPDDRAAIKELYGNV